MTQKLKLAMISLITRRDLQSPLRHFRHIDIVHFYKAASYNDLTVEELQDPQNVPYRSCWDLLKKIRAAKPDVIQGIEPLTFPAGFQEYVVILFCRVVLRIPFFFPMLENRPIAAKFGSFIGFWVTLYLKLYCGLADFVFVVNRGAAQTLTKLDLPEHKIKHVLWGCFGVDPVEFCLPSATEPRRGIVFVGRLTEGKGILVLLNAFASVHRRYPDLPLCIIGQGPLESVVQKRIVQEGWQHVVTVIRSVKNKDMAGYLQRARVVCVPAITTKRWEEQVGMVNMQALACGTPVVSTTSGAIPEFVQHGHTGLLVPENDEQALTEALVQVLENPQERQRLSAAGRRYIEEHFHEVKNIAKAEQIVLNFYSYPI